MINHHATKRDLERTAIQLFIEIYNCNYDSKYRLLYMREQPDSVIEDNISKKKLGVEITHLFYDAIEAKQILGRSKQPERTERNPEKLIDELNGLIATKESKEGLYSKDYPVSLLIRNMSPMYRMSDFIAASECINKPNGVFEDVWFLSKAAAGEWLLYNFNRLNKVGHLKTAAMKRCPR